MELGVPLPTAYHLLATLVKEAFLVKDAARLYYLGPRIGALADAFLRQMQPPEYLRAALRQLAETTGETAYLSSWRNGDIVVLESVEGSQAVRVSGLYSGFSGCAHARASGKLLLAFLPANVLQGYLQTNPLRPLTPHTIVHAGELVAQLKQFHAQGYAIDEEEFRVGVACIATPVTEGETVIGAFTLSAPVERFHRRRQELLDAALSVSRSVSSSSRVQLIATEVAEAIA